MISITLAAAVCVPSVNFSPISAALALPGGGDARPQALEPHQLVQVVRIVETATIGRVDGPDTNPTAHRVDHARLVERWAVLPREAALHVAQPDATEDRDTVPMVAPVVSNLVAQR